MVLHVSGHITEALLDTSTTVCAASTPTTPSAEPAIDGARLLITATDLGERQAMGSTLRLCVYTSGLLLLPATTLL